MRTKTSLTLRLSVAAVVAVAGFAIAAAGASGAELDWSTFYCLSLLLAYCAGSVLTPGRAA